MKLWTGPPKLYKARLNGRIDVLTLSQIHTAMVVDPVCCDVIEATQGWCFDVIWALAGCFDVIADSYSYGC